MWYCQYLLRETSNILSHPDVIPVLSYSQASSPRYQTSSLDLVIVETQEDEKETKRQKDKSEPKKKYETRKMLSDFLIVQLKRPC